MHVHIESPTPPSPPSCHVQNIRVVQPNLVYAVGLTMDICHEDVLKDTEYFGQFGKTVKVGMQSMHSSNDSSAKGLVRDWSHLCA
jgi:hypothetical protein